MAYKLIIAKDKKELDKKFKKFKKKYKSARNTDILPFVDKKGNIKFRLLINY